MAVSVREHAAVRAAVRVPAWAWVAGIVVCSAAFYYLLGRRIVAPWILTDELIYSEAAKSFAANGHLFVRDHSWVALAPVYPAVISPAWALFSHVPDAYAAAKAINSVVISLAAIPAYLLARRVLSQPFALVAAALSVALPSMLYSGTMMTENAFYPVFLGAALTLVLALEKPTIPRTLLLLGLCVLAFLTRGQALALIPPIVTAPLLLVLVRRTGWVGLKRYWALYAGTALLLVVPSLVQVARGHSLTGLFGRYSFVSDQSYPPGPVAKWFVYHLAELDLYTGILPFAALVLLVILARRLPEHIQIFAAAAVTLAFWLLLVVAAFDQTQTAYVNRVEERNMFYVVPLLLVALLVWVDRGMPRPRWPAVVAAVGAAALPVLLPLQWMLNESIKSDTLGLIPWWRLDLLLGSSGWTRAILAACCVGVGALFLFWPSRLRLVLPAIVLVYFLTVLGFAERQWHLTSRSLFDTIGSPSPDWIDRALPPGATAAVVNSGHVLPVVIWEDEFFSRAAGSVYYLSDPTPGGLPEWPTRIAADGTLHAETLGTVRYALADETAVPQGSRIAGGGPLTLYRVPGELRLRTSIHGLYPGEAWSGRTVTYTRYGCVPGHVSVMLANGPAMPAKTVTFRSGRAAGRISVSPGVSLGSKLPVRPRHGVCRIDLSVSPAPIMASPPGTPPRPIGLQFSFR